MTISTLTPFGGTLPAENDPATFPARAEALFDWITLTLQPEFNTSVGQINTALNDDGTVLETAGEAIEIATNANTLVSTGGTGNAYTITAANTIAAYATGQTFMIRVDRANTGAVTLNVDGLGAKAVRKLGSDGSTFTELVAGDFGLGEIHVVTYNGTVFELVSTPANAFVRTDSTQTITGNWTFNGTLAFGDAAQARTAMGLGSVATESTLPVAKGGTGATNAAAARTALGLGSAATENIVPVDKGGTGSGSAVGARGSLGVPSVPTLTGGVPGDFRSIAVTTGSAYTLPSNGTWAWFVLAVNDPALTVDPTRTEAGVNSGGVTIKGAVAGIRYVGLAWRIA